MVSESYCRLDSLPHPIKLAGANVKMRVPSGRPQGNPRWCSVWRMLGSGAGIFSHFAIIAEEERNAANAGDSARCSGKSIARRRGRGTGGPTRAGVGRSPGLRCLPHRPTHRRRRAVRPKLPLIPGHQIVGRVADLGSTAGRFTLGERVGAPWLGWTCGRCRYCVSGRENLCDVARFTGYDLDGGYAEYAALDEHFCFPIPAAYPDLQAAPLLCAGLIGYRALVMTGDAEHVGFYGFGAAAHIVTQVARFQGREVFAFTRPGDRRGRTRRASLARSGPAAATSYLRRSWMRPSSSPRPVPSCRRRCGLWPRAG